MELFLHTLRCQLCPHLCELKNGQTGKCLIRISNGNDIILSTYGQLTNVTAEPIEKKPITNFLQGTKTLSIGSFGCNLSCKFCENHEISQKIIEEKSKYFHPTDIIKLAISKDCESVCMTYNEPIIQYEYLYDLSEECHEDDLKFIIKTNAFVNKEPWKQICKITDAMNIDWKGYGEEYKNICGSSQYVIEDRIKEAFESGVHVEISIPVYPDSSMDFNQIAKSLSLINCHFPIHLLRIFPSHKWEIKYATSVNDLDFVRNVFLSHGLTNISIHS
jgi:pyruvate formate lyase activating enzyme